MNGFKIELFTVEELMKVEFPPTDSMLGNLLDRSGAMLISGPQKIGKSLFASQLALALGDKAPFITFPPGAEYYRTLILQAEVGPKRMQERFRKQSQAFGPAAQSHVCSASVFSSIKLDDKEGVAQMMLLVERFKPDVVIVDPLANFHCGDENVAQDIIRVTSVLDNIRAMGPAVCLVHHHGKSSAERGNVGHKARGSTALAGWYDTHLSLERADKSVRLRFEVRHDETPEDILLKLNPRTLTFETQTDEAAQVTLVVAAIADLGPSDADAVGQYCNKTRQWASDWLNAAVTQDKLVRNGNRPVIFSVPGHAPDTRVHVTQDAVVVTTNTTADGHRAVWIDGEEVRAAE
jgi:RecA-family ATPase